MRLFSVAHINLQRQCACPAKLLLLLMHILHTHAVVRCVQRVQSRSSKNAVCRGVCRRVQGVFALIRALLALMEPPPPIASRCWRNASALRDIKSRVSGLKSQ